MTIRIAPPNGAPFWAGLWMSDVESSDCVYGPQFILRTNNV
jgi:hypothetical protein